MTAGRSGSLLTMMCARKRVSDGIDDGRVNPHSGAEANIVGAQALLPDVASRIGELLDQVADRLEVQAA